MFPNKASLVSNIFSTTRFLSWFDMFLCAAASGHRIASHTPRDEHTAAVDLRCQSTGSFGRLWKRMYLTTGCMVYVCAYVCVCDLCSFSSHKRTHAQHTGVGLAIINQENGVDLHLQFSYSFFLLQNLETLSSEIGALSNLEVLFLAKSMHLIICFCLVCCVCGFVCLLILITPLSTCFVLQLFMLKIYSSFQ